MQSSEEQRLRAIMREARPAPELPPRFQERVWRAIEHADTRASETRSAFATLPRMVERLLIPRFALAALALLLAAGGLAGFASSAGAAKQQAQHRYLSAVAPSPLQ